MATKLFFRNTASDFQTGTNDARLDGTAVGWDNLTLSTTQGAAAGSWGVTSVAGPTNGIEPTSGSTPRVWISDPLDADVTISGSITWNLRAAEAAMTANAAVNAQLEVVDGATGTITLIDKTARTIECGTSESANNFAETPASGVACKRGDRLRVRVFFDDSVDGNMAAGSALTFWFSGAAGATGDSFFTLTENLTFVSEPAGSQIFPTDTASSVSTASVDREAWTSRGAGVQTDVTNTATGWTAPIQVTDSAGGTVVDWFTKQLSAVTLGGAARVNARTVISNTAANAGIRCEVALVDSDGTNPTLWAAATYNAKGPTSQIAHSFLIAGDDLAISNGQRLRIRFYIDDANVVAQTAPMVSGHTHTLYYAGTSAAASGDTYLTFTQTLTEFVAGTTVTPTTLAFVLATFAPTIATPQTVTPTTATLASTAFAPSVILGQTVTPTTLALVLGGAGTTYASDDFSDTVADSMGTADVGGSYTLSGTAADFDKTGSTGTVVTTASLLRFAYLNSIAVQDSDQTILTKIDATPGVTSAFSWLTSRNQGVSDLYYVQLEWRTTGGIRGSIQRRIGGSGSGGTLVALDAVAFGSLTYTAGDWFWMRMQTEGVSPTTIRFNIWKDGTSEPGSWAQTTTDSTSPLQSTGALGFATTAGSTMTPARLISFDTYAAASIATALLPTVTVSNNQLVTPTTLALTLATFAPTVTATVNQLVTPTTLALTLAAFAPTVTASNHQLVTPTTLALALTTFAPTVTTAANQIVTPTTATLTLATFAPTLGLAVIPTTAALTLTTFAPSVTASNHQMVTPTTATLALTTFAPVFKLAVIPSTAALTVTLFAPTLTLSDHKLATPTTIALALTTYAPTVTASNHQTVTPTTAALVLAVFAPTVSTPRLATPTTLALTLTTFAPSVTASNHQMATPTTKALTLAVFAPTVTATAHVTVTPTTASLALAFQAPSVTVGDAREVTPNTASLTLTTFAPTVTGAQNVTATPTTKALTLAVFAPTVTATAAQLVTPSTAPLTLTLLSPIVTATAGQTVVPTTKALTLTTFAPTVTATAHVTVTPTTKALTLTTFAPSAVIGYRVTPTTAALTTSMFAPTLAISDHAFVIPGTLPLVLTGYPPDAIGVAPVIAIPPTASLVLTPHLAIVAVNPPFDQMHGVLVQDDFHGGVLVVTGPRHGATVTQTRGRTTLVVTTPRVDAEIESN